MKPATAIEPDELCALIRDTAALYVGSPANLAVRWTTGERGAVLFGARGNPDDTGRLIGRDGSHAHSLGRLVRLAGSASGREFGFRLITERGLDRPWIAPQKLGRYDPSPAKELLGRWLRVLGFPDCPVAAEARSELAGQLWFDLDIYAVDRTVSAALSDVDGDPSGMSAIEAIGTIFRAIGKSAGSVRLQVNLR